jgi:hypothetical protein
MIIKKQKLINGPIIAMRLEGNINGINKVFYLFGDIHKSLEEETKCSSFDAVNFIQYFRNTLKHTDKNINYDFFLEMEDDDKSLNDNEKKDIYIFEIRKYFNYQKNINEKSNLTLYYCDIRNYFFNNSFKYYSDIENIMNELYATNEVNDIKVNNIKNILFELNKMIELTTNVLLNNINDEHKKIYEDEYYKKNKYYSEKILNKYDNKNVRDILLNKTFLLYEIKQNVKIIKESSLEAEKHLETLNELIKNYDRKIYNNDYGLDFSTKIKIILKIIENLDNILIKYIKLYTCIMDLYLLRKILDKNYITHAIIYTGNSHLFNYVYVLVNNFDFKITHTANKEISIEKLYIIIKNKYSDNLSSKILPNKLLQCIDVTDFPEKFM